MEEQLSNNQRFFVEFIKEFNLDIINNWCDEDRLEVLKNQVIADLSKQHLNFVKDVVSIQEKDSKNKAMTLKEIKKLVFKILDHNVKNLSPDEFLLFYHNNINIKFNFNFDILDIFECMEYINDNINISMNELSKEEDFKQCVVEIIGLEWKRKRGFK